MRPAPSAAALRQPTGTHSRQASAARAFRAAAHIAARAADSWIGMHRSAGRWFAAREGLRPGRRPPRLDSPGSRLGVPVRSRRFLALGVVAAGGTLLAALLPTVAGASGENYVALGDSFTSGPLIPRLTGSPVGCLRSSHDYPSLVAAMIGPSSFRDVSCQGADTTNMTGPEGVGLGTNPPQLHALGRATTLVTLGIGGNDIGFSNIVLLCSALSFTNPFGSPCKGHYTSGGTDRLARAVAQTGPKVAAVLAAIHRLAPAARVLLVGYPVILPNTGRGCWPVVPFAFGDVPYLRGVELKLNQMLASEALAHGAIYVDTYNDSIGHDMCQAPGTKWVEGIVPTSLAAPVHPNALEEKAMAQQVFATLG
ncbi:MAG TPA: SGNH/GDSL hydrolase family protein [Streptosporangiaceae bacterium]